MPTNSPKAHQRIGFTCSTFDLLHAGHIGMLREAKENCDYLIVALQTDPTIDRPKEKNKPVQTVVERYAQLNALDLVDEIVPYETERDLVDILELFRIDVRFIGIEYKSKDFTGKEECSHRGIDIHYNKRDHRFSSSGLRERVAEAQANKKPKESK
ncbi:MAG: adenylyltransferase/cytidyltransferase family protein [Phycisphaerae bacterium]|jgi:glycerol-3-phosphate cytidylyltransferase|nr:adenylyltransferase/cytidyltransferase family protein [Phycisphaerae bacterium]